MLCVTTFCTLKVMTSSVQKVVTHNTNYADSRYQLPRIDKQYFDVSIAFEELIWGHQ